jgi:hypothetical protein
VHELEEDGVVRFIAAFGVTSGLICTAAVFAASAGPRTGYFSPGIAPRSPEVMLYISHSIGAGSGGHPTFGLKVDQLRQVGDSGDPESGDVMQHRELVNWQMEAHSNMHISDLRVQLGHRVTYDVTHRRFGSPVTRQTLQLGVPSLRNQPLGGAQPKALFAASPSVSAAAGADGASALHHDSFRDNSGLREIASAAIAALSPARFTAAQRELAQRPGLTAQQHLPPQRGGFTNAN